MSHGKTTSYRELVRRHPRPTDDQIRAFATFVGRDHSWYKHLPMDGMGEPFFFYLDPHVHALLIQTEGGGAAWRALLRDPPPSQPWYPRWRIDLQPGDIEPRNLAPLNHSARGMATAEYRTRLGHWSYWNHGPRDQPRDAALLSAVQHLRVQGDDGRPVAVPHEALELGLVHLRATISGLGPMEEQYERLREEWRLPSAEDDHAQQYEQILAALHRVAAWIYES